MANEPLLFKGDRILLTESFLSLLTQRPDYYNRYIVTLEGFIDGPEGKVLILHNELK